MLFLYVRHGDPIYSPDSLTELGHKQAEALKLRLKTAGVKEIYSSTSTRAVMTATPTAEMLGLPIKQLDWCHESHAWRDFSAMIDGKRKWSWTDPELTNFFNTKEIRALDKEWYDHPRFKETNYKAGYQRIQNEADAFFESLGYRHRHDLNGYEVIEPNEKCVALFAHEGFGRLFLSAILDIPYPLYSTRYAISHTSVTAIYFSNKAEITRPTVLQHANDSHLFVAGLPTQF